MHRDGFTLVEMMAVVAILAIVSAIAAPSFSELLARSRLRGVGSEAYADLQYARSESAQRNRVVRAEFSASGYEIWLMTAADPTARDTRLKAVDWTASGVAPTSGATMVGIFDPVRATATVSSGPLVLGHSAVSGTLRLTLAVTGRAQLCTPSGAVSGVSAC